MALRLTSGLLFGVGPFDPATLLTVASATGWSVDRRVNDPGRSRRAARVSVVSLNLHLSRHKDDCRDDRPGVSGSGLRPSASGAEDRIGFNKLP